MTSCIESSCAQRDSQTDRKSDYFIIYQCSLRSPWRTVVSVSPNVGGAGGGSGGLRRFDNRRRTVNGHDGTLLAEVLVSQSFQRRTGFRFTPELFVVVPRDPYRPSQFTDLTTRLR